MGTLSKNEQIAFYIVIFVVIVLAGLFIFMLPEAQKIEPNKEALNAKQAEYDSLESELGKARRDELERNIIAAYEDGKGASEFFFNEDFTDYEADQFIRELLSNVPELGGGAALGLDEKLTNLFVSRNSKQGLSIIPFLQEDETYDIAEMAKIQGVVVTSGDAAAAGNTGAATGGEVVAEAPNAPTDPNEMNAEQLARYLKGNTRRGAIDFFEENRKSMAPNITAAMKEYLATDFETVGLQTVSFKMDMTEEEAFALSMYLHEYETAIYVNSMTSMEIITAGVPTPPFGGFGGGGDDEGGGQAPATPTNTDGLRSYTFIISFYIVPLMEEPQPGLFNTELW